MKPPFPTQGLQALLDADGTQPLGDFDPTQDFHSLLWATDEFWESALAAFTPGGEDSVDVPALRGYLNWISRELYPVVATAPIGDLTQLAVALVGGIVPVFAVRIGDGRVLLLGEIEATSLTTTESDGVL